MSPALDAVLQQFLDLDPEEQQTFLRLAEAAAGEASSPEWEAEWTAEVNRRIADIRSGKTQLLDAQESLARLYTVAK